MITDQLYKVPEALPNIPSNIDRQSLNTLIREYSIRNKLVVSVTRSDAKSSVPQCVKSGKQREPQGIEDPSKCLAEMSHKTEWPFIKFVKPKGKSLFNLLDPKNENELYHNHPVDDLNLLSTSKGGKSILEVDDMRKISFGLEQNSSARKIQNTITKDSLYSKLTKAGVRNMKSV